MFQQIPQLASTETFYGRGQFLVEVVFQTVLGLQTELLIFAAAFCVHAALLQGHRVKKMKVAKHSPLEDDEIHQGHSFTDAQEIKHGIQLHHSKPRIGGSADELSRMLQEASGRDTMSEQVTAKLALVEAALREGRLDVVENLMATCDTHCHVSLMKSLAGRDWHVDQVSKVFHACPKKTTCLYNAILGICIDASDLNAAEEIMAEAIQNEIADIVTYNTMLKAQAQSGGLHRARELIVAMRKVGLQPKNSTFNELLECAVKQNMDEVWDLIADMRACSLKPNNITCSILLKCIQQDSKVMNVERTMSVVNDMDDEMDDVLLSSLVEACIRAGRCDLLVPQLRQQRSGKKVQVRSSHTYGSIIRAFGYVNDVTGVWDTWHEMKSRHILPSSITLGCMVEALVTNGDIEGGHRIIKEAANDQHGKQLVNAVMYCSVLKGFSHQKRFDRVWAVYKEMIEQKLQFSIVTFNALVDACARSSDMCRIPGLLDDMDKQGIEPNLITYSTILKGYCKENRLDKALELVKSMKQTTGFRPDEVMFNSLLDGCARQCRYEQGMQLLVEMQEAGVRPTNFTLSVLVKVASRGKRLDKAFELCDEISKQYKFKLNIHVYSNLVHACIANNDIPRGLSVLQRLLSERVRPDQRTYTLLLQAYASLGDAQQIAGLLSAAMGLENPHPALARFTSVALQPQGGLAVEAISEAIEQIAIKEERLAMTLLQNLKQQHPRLKLDAKMQLKLANRAMHTRAKTSDGPNGVVPPWRRQ